MRPYGSHPRGIPRQVETAGHAPSYKPWHDKPSGRTFLKADTGKCLHYYFYFIDRDLGLCYLRVPTWAPFRLQFYFNGHGSAGGRAAQTADRGPDAG
ncbi:MAG: hypothetical protein MZV70_40185 [Desulfobacterales bacterium]|nr:hypothetical protein [Desulfobacterales bacterium]